MELYYISFLYDNEMVTVKAKVYNDAFYEIVEGAELGSLVHVSKITSIVKI